MFDVVNIGVGLLIIGRGRGSYGYEAGSASSRTCRWCGTRSGWGTMQVKHDVQRSFAQLC